MSNLTENRDTREILCGSMSYSHKIRTADGAVIYTGAIAGINAQGLAVPASDTAGITVLGICGGTAGNAAFIRTGVFLLDNASGTEKLTVSDIGKTVYVLDDHTVGKTGGTNRIPAGILRDVQDNSVCVEVAANQPAGIRITVLNEDPAPASPETSGTVAVVGTPWTGGTVIGSANEDEVYLNTGAKWIKLA